MWLKIVQIDRCVVKMLCTLFNIFYGHTYHRYNILYTYSILPQCTLLYDRIHRRVQHMIIHNNVLCIV